MSAITSCIITSIIALYTFNNRVNDNNNPANDNNNGAVNQTRPIYNIK